MGKRKSADAAADGAKGGAGAKPAGRPGRRRKDDIELEEEGAKGPELVLSVPGALKQWLVDDWRAITHEGRLHVVPSAPTVRQLVEDYTEKLKRATSGQRLLDATSVANGVLDWFDLACEKQLLYDPERKQYTQHCAKGGASPCDVYGGEHLLRLFVKLPAIMGAVEREDVTEELVKGAATHCTEMLEFIAKNQTKYLKGEYEGGKRVKQISAAEKLADALQGGSRSGGRRR